MSRERTQLVLGRGEVYFDRFPEGEREGEGERYFGNTTTFQISRSVKRLGRSTSLRGKIVEQKGIVLSEEIGLKFITDHISMDNMGDWFGRKSSPTNYVSIRTVRETFTVLRGRYYQLGKSVIPAIGLRHVEYVDIFIGGERLDESSNFITDKISGRVFIRDNAPDIPDGAMVEVSFDFRDSSSVELVDETPEVYGAMRYMSHNAHGPDKNYYFPMVRLESKGAIDLKGDEFQQVNFEAVVMSVNPNVQMMYVYENETVGLSLDEKSLIIDGIGFTDFPLYEDQLDHVVNTVMPSRGY